MLVADPVTEPWPKNDTELDVQKTKNLWSAVYRDQMLKTMPFRIVVPAVVRENASLWESLLMEIFSKMKPYQVITMSRVCKQWNR